MIKEIPDSELSIERYSAPGQLVNENPRGVLITHKPTGLSASSEDKRTAIQNEVIALSELYNTVEIHQCER